MDNDDFRGRVRAAAEAAWWVVLIATVVFTVQWLVFLFVVPSQPAWLLSLWGPGAAWPEVRSVWLDALVAFKLGLFSAAGMALWLTLWSRQLRRDSNRS